MLFKKETLKHSFHSKLAQKPAFTHLELTCSSFSILGGGSWLPVTMGCLS